MRQSEKEEPRQKQGRNQREEMKKKHQKKAYGETEK